MRMMNRDTDLCLLTWAGTGGSWGEQRSQILLHLLADFAETNL